MASPVTEVTVTAERRHGKDRFLLFGERVPWGESRTIYEVDGHTFKTREDAEAFAAQTYPRQTADGRWVTNETPPRSFTSQERATARQAAVDEGSE